MALLYSQYLPFQPPMLEMSKISPIRSPISNSGRLFSTNLREINTIVWGIHCFAAQSSIKGGISAGKNH
jgi:hypothetical protein